MKHKIMRHIGPTAKKMFRVSGFKFQDNGNNKISKKIYPPE